MKKILSTTILGLLAANSYAGFNGLTTHSRANCYNNETISWDATRSWVLMTHSDHAFRDNRICCLITGWHKTWRSAAVHWGEGTTGEWNVAGEHYIVNEKHHRVLFAHEDVTDCSIYDGWWSIPAKMHPAQPDGNDGGNDDTGNQQDTPQLSKIKQDKMVADTYQAVQADFDKQEAEFKRNGFYKTNSDYAHYLLSLRTYARDEIKEFSTTKDLEDTHLKQVPTQIKLAFTFDANKISKPIIGYAPLGSFIQKKGWTGVKVVFTSDDLTCSYSYFNLGLAGGYVENTDGQQAKLVDGKDTVLNAEGDDETGYLYQVTVYTKSTMEMTECASKNYSANYMQQTVRLAKEIN